MAHDEFSREEIPSEGVSIGGDDDCEHETYRRFGSDGGGNIYFRCTNCSNVVLNYDSTNQDDREAERIDPELTPDNSGSKPDPLMKGLSFDSDEQSDDNAPVGRTDGFLSKLKSDLTALLPGQDDN